MNNLIFKLDGPALDRGMPLHIISESFKNAQSIFDKSYCTLTNRKRIFPKDRVNFYLSATEIQHKCILSNIDLVISIAQPTLSIVQSIGAQDIINLTFETFNFLRLVCGLLKNKKEYTIEQNNKNCTIFTGNNSFVFNGNVYLNGQDSLPQWQYIAEQISSDGVNKFSLSSNNKKIALGTNNKEIFSLPEEIVPEFDTYTCNIVKFDKRKGTGKLEILSFSGGVISTAGFDIAGNQATSIYIKSMLKKRVELVCTKTISTNPITGDESISKLHVVAVKDKDIEGQNSLLW